MDTIYEKVNAPAYIFDINELDKHMIKVSQICSSKIDLCYAMKANPFLINAMSNYVSKIEVCSFGEFQIVERSGLSIERVILSGVYKNDDEVDYIVKTYGDGLTYTIESISQYYLLKEKARVYSKTLKVLIRLTSGNQFGLSEDDLNHILDDMVNYECIELRGLHYFTGTQKTSSTKYEKDFTYLINILQKIESKYNIDNLKIEYGPGFFVEYFENITDEAIYKQLNQLVDFINQNKIKYKITLEAGRFFAAYCGHYIAEVVDTKVVKQNYFCIVDGGIHHINYFGQTMALKKPPVWLLNESKDCEKKTWTVFGSLCTTSDVLVRQFECRDLKIGDRLIFDRVGAYAVTEGIALFLSHDLPSVYLVDKHKELQCVRNAVKTEQFNYFMEVEK